MIRFIRTKMAITTKYEWLWFNTEQDNTNLELRLVGEYKDREVTEVLQLHFRGSQMHRWFMMRGPQANMN